MKTLLYFLWIDPINLTCKGRGKGKGYDSSGTPQNCLFPFIHGGKIFKGCATNGRSGSWCATKIDSKGKMKNWARCNQYCKKDNGMFFESFFLLTLDIERTTLYFIWNVGEYVICKARGTGKRYSKRGTALNCKSSFIYLGKRYSNGCVQDRGKSPWCATKVDSKGNLKKWARCNKYCSKTPSKCISMTCRFF